MGNVYNFPENCCADPGLFERSIVLYVIVKVVPIIQNLRTAENHRSHRSIKQPNKVAIFKSKLLMLLVMC